MAYYFPKTLEQYTIALMDMFNDIQVNRYTSAGTIAKTINVPIGFGPVDKAYQFRKELEQSSDKPNYIMSLPRLAITFNGFAFAPDRAKAINEARFWQEALNLTTENFQDFQPIPYDYYFSFWVKADLLSDYSQIMEQILPYFSPSRTLRVREFSWLNIERDLPVHMTATTVDLESQLALDENSKREINGNCTLTIHGWTYKPVSASKIIEHIDVKYFISPDILNVTEETVIDGYATSAAVPTSGYASSGVTDKGNYYTITETSAT